MKSEIITCVHSETDSVFDFTEFSSYESNSLTHCMVCFIPAMTINCVPPYVKGKVDSCWIAFRERPANKNELEERLGMPIERWE
jgi:hypothetical protein